MTPIYLDYNASTPIEPEVAAAMRPFLEGAYGNPSSGHWASAPAKAALESARGQVAALLGCASDEVVFTSGGSEANNLALKGLFFRRRGRPSHRDHLPDRAPGDARAVPLSGAPGRHGHLRAGRRRRPRRSRRHPQGDHHGHLSDQHHAREQRGRHDPADRRDRKDRPRARHSACTPTRLNRSARSRPRSTSSASTFSRSRGTRSMRRRVLARSISAAGSRSSRSSTVPDTRAAGAPARRARCSTTALGTACEIAQPWIGMPGSAAAARSVLGASARRLWQSGRAQRPSRASSAQHAQRLVRRPRRRRHPRAHAGRRCLDRLCLSFRSRSRSRRCSRPWASLPRSAWAPSASASGAARRRKRSRRSSTD